MNRKRLRVLVAGVLGAWAASAAPAQPTRGEPPVFGEIVEVRTGFVRVVLPADAPPPRVETLEVRWKRRPQRIVRVVGGAEAALELGLAVDLSASLHDLFEPMRDAAMSVLGGVLTERDRAFAVGFSATLVPLAEGRGEVERVLAALPSAPAPGDTALFHALELAIEHFDNVDARAGLIVVTDGCDTTPAPGSARALRLARERAVPIFVLSPRRDVCRHVACRSVSDGTWRCGNAKPKPGRRSWLGGAHPAATPEDLWEVGDQVPAPMREATDARDHFFGRLERSGGVFILDGPEAWQPALDAIAARLARQWMVVYEPESDAVRSDEVEIYQRIGGRRRRLR